MQSHTIWLLIVLTAILLCVFGVMRSRNAKPMSPADFTREFAKKVGPTLPGFTVDIKGERELRITNAKGKESTMFLDNAYAEYVHDPQALSAIVRKYGAGLAEFPGEGVSIDRSRIVPIVKDRKWLAEIRQSLTARGAKQPPENVFDELNDELIVVYAEDSPEHPIFDAEEPVRHRNRARGTEGSGGGEPQATRPKIEVRPGPLFSMVKADGNYEASLLLFDDLWSNAQIKVDGDFVVAIPARDVLLVTGSRNPAGIVKLRELAAQIVRESSYHLTGTLRIPEGFFPKTAAAVISGGWYAGTRRRW